MSLASFLFPLPVAADVRFKDDSVHPILNLVVFAVAVGLVLIPCLWGIRKTLKALAAAEETIKAEESADAERQILTTKDRKLEERDRSDPSSNMHINPILKLWWKEHTRLFASNSPRCPWLSSSEH
jgi:hypothetical protein